MSAQNNGWPAFPVQSAADWQGHGMTLRDHFAGKALAGLLADLPKMLYGPDWQRSTARTAYELADAMLAAREVKP